MTYSKLDQPEVLSYIFQPQAIERNVGPVNSTDIDVEVAEDVTLGCRFYGAHLEGATILYFHGNGEVVSDYDEISQHFIAQGFNFFMTTYRGYGWSTGTPTVTAMYEDAETLYVKAKAWLRENNYSGPIVVMGRSLGSAPAIDLMNEHQDELKALIIESGFANTIPLFKSLGMDVDALELTEADGFFNRKKIEEVTKPTMILHGSKDSLIPIGQAEHLQAFCGARNKVFQMIPGAEHNTMIATAGDKYFETIKTWFDKLMGVTNWGYKKVDRTKR